MKTLTFPNTGALLLALCCATEGFAAIDRTFRPGTGISGGDETSGNVVVPLADGRILLGGDFSTYNGVARPDLVLLHADGSLDESLHLVGGVNGPDEPAIRSVGFQPDGKIIVSGNFTTISGVAARFARLHPDGTLDTTWVPRFRQLGGWVQSIVLPDGRILGWNPFGIERLNADGSADTNFNVVVGGRFLRLSSVSLQADGRILLAGALDSVNDVPVRNVARLHADGSVDTSFLAGQFGSGPDAFNWVNGAEQMPDGRILVFGRFGAVDGHARPGLAILRSNGQLDISARFGGQRDYVWRARALSNGSIVAHSVREALFPNGFDVTLYSEPRGLDKFKGRPWKIEFSVFPNAYVTDIAEDARGRILIVGEFWKLNGVRVPVGIARLRRK